MSRDVRLYLEEMLLSARKVERYARDIDLSDFQARGERFDAIVRNLELIGEGAKHVPQSIRARFPTIEWRSIAGLRDVLIHTYFALDDETLWDLVKAKIPALIVELERILRTNLP